jgi:hypothetical protein
MELDLTAEQTGSALTGISSSAWGRRSLSMEYRGPG